jgi:hypothetical protein
MPIILSGDGYSLTIDPNAHVRKQTMLSASAAIGKVTTNDESGDARVHLSRLAAMRIEVDRCRKEIKEPVLRVGKLIDQAAKEFLSEIELEECRIKGLIGDHATEVARLKAIAEAEERRAFEFARAAREAAEESGRIADVLAHREAVAAKLAASDEVASTKVAQGVRFAWDFDIENVHDVYKAEPMFVSLEVKRAAVLAWLKELAAADEDVVGRAALLGIFAFKKPVVSSK